MWVFCHLSYTDQGGNGFSIGYIQGSKGIWVEVTREETFEDACRMVNYLNGGNGFPLNLKPPATPPVSPTVPTDPVTGRLPEYYEDPNKVLPDLLQ